MPTELYNTPAWRQSPRTTEASIARAMHITLLSSPPIGRLALAARPSDNDEWSLNYGQPASVIRDFLASKRVPGWMINRVNAWIRPPQPDPYAELVIHVA